MRHDRVVGVMVSAKDYEAMRLFYADRLQHRLAQSAQLAEAAGLTENKLDELLSERD
jgi:PHD/YefM family antitoxin component YafN of YafNO toxin-antitoxin module